MQTAITIVHGSKPGGAAITVALSGHLTPGECSLMFKREWNYRAMLWRHSYLDSDVTLAGGTCPEIKGAPPLT